MPVRREKIALSVPSNPVRLQTDESLDFHCDALALALRRDDPLRADIYQQVRSIYRNRQWIVCDCPTVLHLRPHARFVVNVFCRHTFLTVRCIIPRPALAAQSHWSDAAVLAACLRPHCHRLWDLHGM